MSTPRSPRQEVHVRILKSMEEGDCGLRATTLSELSIGDSCGIFFHLYLPDVVNDQVSLRFWIDPCIAIKDLIPSPNDGPLLESVEN